MQNKKTQSPKGDLFKDGWVVQGRGPNNVASPVGNHAPAKAAAPKKARTRVDIVGTKMPTMPSISSVAKGDLFNKVGMNTNYTPSAAKSEKKK